MKGVMLKSLYNLKRPFNIVLFVCLILFGFGVNFLVLQSPSWNFDEEMLEFMTFEPSYLEFWIIAGLISMILTARSLDTLMVDGNEKWNRYCDVTPLGRPKYILSYYTLMTGLNFIYTCLMSLMPLYTMFVVKTRYGISPDFQAFILGFVIIFAAGQIVLSLGIFAISNFGALGIALLFVLFGVLGIFVMSQGFLDIGEFIYNNNKLLLSSAALLIAAVFTVVSYLITVMMYKKKEL